MIEGEIVAGKRTVEGPFGEYTGYTGPQRVSWLFEAKALNFRSNGIICEVELDSTEVNLENGQATALFRICQEALTNVVRHAEATRVMVRLHRENGAVTLLIEDDGRGIRPEEIAIPHSFGLIGMRERTQILGGRVSIAAAAGGGTEVTVQLPVRGKD